MLKYRIKEIIKQKPANERQALRQKIRDDLRLSPVMYSRYVHSKLTDSLDFDGYQLVVIANILKCKIDDLFPVAETVEGL